MAAGPFESVPANLRGVSGHGLLSADQYTLSERDLGSLGTRVTDVYNGIEFNSNYFAPATSLGYAGFDDYQTSTAPGGSYGGGVDFMTSHDIVVFNDTGASSTTLVFFTFFTASGTPFDSYGVLLPADGTGHWYTINITGGMYVPSDGIVQMYVNDFNATYGQVPMSWYASSGAPTIGTNNSAFGSDAPDNKMHTITIPAPASLAMLGLGGALAVRRRR
jgi:hypothetical protein